MPDDRPLIDKLRAMANQTASPDEAEIARAMIQRMLGMDEDNVHKAYQDPSRVLSRESILSTPDRETTGKVMRMQTKSGTWYTIDVDEMEINISADAIEQKLP